MNLTTILPIMGKKLLVMHLLVAGSVLCTTKAEYEQFIPAQIKPEPISYSEATNFFIKNEQYFTDEQKLELLQKIGSMVDDDLLSASPKQQLLRGINITKSTTNSMMQLASNTEDAESSKTAIEAMEEAIESSEKAVEYLQSLTSNIIDSAMQVKQEVAKWQKKIEGLTSKSMNDYVVKVSQITIILNESSIEAENLMQTMLDMVTLVINRMKLHVDDDDLLKEAVIDVQNMMGAQMKATALGLKGLESKVAEAQTGFEVIAEMSESYSQVITDNLNNKSGYITKKADSLRKKAYGGCAACVIMPWSCPICYATAAGVVETKIKELKDDLRRTKNSLNSIKSHFDSLQLQCDDLKTAAATQYDNINNIKINLTTTSKLVVASDKLSFWRSVILPRLESLKIQLLAIEEGQPVKCSAASHPVYRYTNKQLRWYPNPAIASSWDPDWRQTYKVIDCTGIPQGSNMIFNVQEGQPVKCSATSRAVFRIINKQLRLYPSAAIASSWDPDWRQTYEVIDCTGIPQGSNMIFNVQEGQPVKCNAASHPVYRITNNERRWYPNPAIASSWDPDWRQTYKVIDCTGIPQGSNMIFNVQEGQSIKCSATSHPVYRYTNNERRWYPNPAIASSWDPDWRQTYKVIDCTGIPSGLPMKLKTN
jgi:hypothetical protein